MYFTSARNKNPYIMATSVEEIDYGKRGSDRVLLAVVVMLIMVGLMAVYSSIAYFAETKHVSAIHLVFGHLIKLFIAFIILLIFSKIDYHKVMKYSRIALIMSWIFLAALIAFGAEKYGAKRWIDIAGFSFQPSSMAEASLLVYVVALIQQKQDYIKDFSKTFVPIMFWVVTTCALIGIEDFSSAALLMLICLMVMFVGRISTLHLGGLIAIGVLGSILLIGHSHERQQRIKSYINNIVHIKSDQFALDDGYQTQQAEIAVARGELFGVGPGKSAQRYFLPAPYNDFIFAIISEEYGLIGAAFILLLYIVILARGFLYIAKMPWIPPGFSWPPPVRYPSFCMLSSMRQWHRDYSR
ncbi:MAG TPA: FtsW/RodA/SpoVE family cell cycle protein [Balneolales bacterium]|nr:FtsW/RodA/SpoVE family cell cycle protein [Balneolales bacterium]